MTIDKEISLKGVVAETEAANLDNEIMVIEAVNPFRHLSFPLRFDSLMIGLVLKGTGTLGIDLKSYELKERTMVVLHPRNYIYSAECSEDLTVLLVAVSQEIIESILPKLTDLMPLLMHHRSDPVEQISERDAKGLTRFCEYLTEQLRRPRTPFIRQKVTCLLQSVLFEMMDMQCRREKIPEFQKSRKEEIMARFILLVSEHFRTDRQVSFYAKKLCITPKHLSSVVKEISGRTAGDWIENYVVVEAKVLLRTTDLPIQDISERLNFPNQSFFGKYFKHHTSMSPSEYRKLKS